MTLPWQAAMQRAPGGCWAGHRAPLHDCARRQHRARACSTAPQPAAGAAPKRGGARRRQPTAQQGASEAAESSKEPAATASVAVTTQAPASGVEKELAAAPAGRNSSNGAGQWRSSNGRKPPQDAAAPLVLIARPLPRVLLLHTGGTLGMDAGQSYEVVSSGGGGGWRGRVCQPVSSAAPQRGGGGGLAHARGLPARCPGAGHGGAFRSEARDGRQLSQAGHDCAEARCGVLACVRQWAARGRPPAGAGWPVHLLLLLPLSGTMLSNLLRVVPEVRRLHASTMCTAPGRGGMPLLGQHQLPVLDPAPRGQVAADQGAVCCSCQTLRSWTCASCSTATPATWALPSGCSWPRHCMQTATNLTRF